MSIMVVQLAPQGLLIGADRNITTWVTLKTGATTLVVSGQSQRPKVLKWPNQEVIVGYVGQAELDGVPTDQWLYAFIGRHLQFTRLQDVADALTAELNAIFHMFPDSETVFHLGGFEVDKGEWKPRIFYIRNTTSPGVVGRQFDCSDEIMKPQYYGTKSGNRIRSELAPPAYFSFRQGFDLAKFNAIELALRLALDALINAKLQPEPKTLDDLANQMRFQIYGYGAYFAAFFEPFRQYVGGGADVVTVPWP